MCDDPVVAAECRYDGGEESCLTIIDRETYASLWDQVVVESALRAAQDNMGDALWTKTGMGD